MATYRIQLAWTTGGGLVYSPPDPPCPWISAELEATAVPYAILIALLSWGRSGADSMPSEPYGWWGEAHLDGDALPWGSRVWERINDPVTAETAGLLAADARDALRPLQTAGLLGDVVIEATPGGGCYCDGSIDLTVGFDQPADGGGRYAPLWQAYQESMGG